MKTTTIKSLLVKIALLLAITSASAQDLVGTRIDVQGATSGDQMWLFSVATCTRNFDNGWDGFKMFGTSVAPQLFAMEPDGYFQVDAVADVNNTYLGFKAGVDSVYTFTFTHQNLSFDYKQLYLVDSIANKTVDIYADGATYTFTATNTAAVVKRFKIITSVPQLPVATTTTPTTPSTPATTPTVVNTNPSVPSVNTTPATSSTDPVTPAISTKKTTNTFTEKEKNIKIYATKKMIVVNNQGKQKGVLRLYDANSGKLVKNTEFNANGTTTIQVEQPAGTYVVYGMSQNEELSKTIVLL